MARWAVFDVDGTLLPQISMERKFLDYLMKNTLLPFGSLIYYLFKGFTIAITHGWMEAIKGNKAYLKGLSVSAVDKYADVCFRQQIVTFLAPAGKQKAEILHQEGYKILIISGSPAFLASRLEPVYHPDLIVSTELEIKNGYYSGKISGLHPYGKRKRIILEKLREEFDIDFAKSIVFSDHHSDVHHMKLFGRAVAVNPTNKLQNVAQSQGWEIAIWI